MPRRIHTPVLTVGEVLLAPAQAHHLCHVLRLGDGDAVEAFDDRGATALATVVRSGGQVKLRIAAITPAAAAAGWSIASAVPKGQRADWLVEKLSELGAAEFIPLKTERSVTHPAGSQKPTRWERLAAEAARQSGRTGVMRIAPLTDLAALLAERRGKAMWHLSLEPGAAAIAAPIVTPLVVMVGPEGGWSEAELAAFGAGGSRAVRLTRTILRVETAAIAAGAILATLL